MEEETVRKKQAEGWGAVLLVSAQNMDIPAHCLVCQYLLWGMLLHNRASICRLSSMIQNLGEKRLTLDSAQEFPGPSIGVLPLHMIEEETTGEDGDHTEETPSSPPCSGQMLSADQYRTHNTHLLLFSFFLLPNHAG